MRAIRVHQFGGPDVLTIEDVAELQPLGGQVRVKVAAAGVNPVDTYIRAGAYATLPALAYTPGNDAAGVIDAVGPGVTTFAVGDRVYVAGSTSGTYAEQCLATVDHVRPLPQNVSFDQGAGVGVPYITAYRAIFEKANVLPGETVLVHGGSGAVGVAAIQLLLHLGASVIATAGTAAGTDLIKQQGVHHALSHKDDARYAQMTALTHGCGFDVVLEMSAHLNLGKDLTVLAHGGRVVIIGSRGEVTVNPRDLMKCDGRILGLLGNFEHREQVHHAIGQGLREGWLKPVISRTFALADAAAAHRMLMETSANGKLVLRP